MRVRGVRSLSLIVAIALWGLVAATGAAHHGSPGDCSGTADFCVPNGVFTITWTNTNPSDCRFDVTVRWGDGATSSVPDIRTGQSTSHTYAGHGFFTASTSAVTTGGTTARSTPARR